MTVTLPFAFCLTDTVLSISILSDLPFEPRRRKPSATELDSVIELPPNVTVRKPGLPVNSVTVIVPFLALRPRTSVGPTLIFVLPTPFEIVTGVAFGAPLQFLPQCLASWSL